VIPIVHSNRMSSKRVVVLGASGRLGFLIAKALGTRGAKIVSVVRDKSLDNEHIQTLTKSFQMEVIQGDFTEENLHKACKGAFAVVSALQGGPDVIIDLQLKILEVAKKEKVKRFIPSDFSMDLFVLEDGENINSDWRRKFGQQADKVKGDVEVVHVLNGAFMDGGVLFGFVGWFDLKNNKAFRWGKGDVPLHVTTYEDTAQYTAEVALDDKPVPSKFCVAGDTLSLNDIISTYNEVTKKTLHVEEMGSLDDYHSQTMAKFKENPKDMRAFLPGMYGHPMLSGKSSLPTVDNSRYPNVKPTKIREYIQKEFASS